MAKDIGIFETQRRSDWFQDMFLSVGNDIGHHEYTWGQRACMAFGVAGCEGKEMTAAEIHDTVAPYVGKNKPQLAGMIHYGQTKGIIISTGEKLSYQGDKKYLAYDVVGHLIPTDTIRFDRHQPDTVMMSDLWPD